MNLLILSVAPVFVILSYIYYRDKYEKEPLNMLIKGLIAGIIIVIPVVWVEQTVSSYLNLIFTTKVSQAFGNAFLVAGFCEELFKFTALYLLIWNNKNFNERFDGIVYAVFVSLGFAMIENIIYVFTSGFSTGLTRAFTAVPAHAMFGILMGFYFGLAKFIPEKKTIYFFLSFIVPFIFHGIYDFILMVKINWVLILFFPFLIFMMYQTNHKMKEHSENSVFKS